MNRCLSYHIETDSRIGDYLRKKGYSRRLFIHLKKFPGSIRLNGVPKYLDEPVKPGDTLTVYYEEESSSETICPVDLPIHIVYEDEDIAVLDKAVDMPVHPSQGNHGNTLANALAAYYRKQGEPFVFRCINRLDRDTSGLLLAAKNGISGCILSNQMKERKMKREYYAIVQGKLPPEGIIDAPIARKEGSALERQVDWQRGERAVTHFKRIVCQDGLSLASIWLETGRTHQIRVHMRYIGHPLPGDFLYYPHYERLKRQALHSAALTFFHPVTGEKMCIRSELPEYFTNIFSFQKGKTVV